MTTSPAIPMQSGRSRRYNAGMNATAPRSVADIEGFVDLLKAACEDEKINATLERLLAMRDAQRQGVVHAWVSDLMIAEAPREFIEAVACLIDDAVAEKAYEVIYQCGRGSAGTA
jgi:hypothetical protein